MGRKLRIQFNITENVKIEKNDNNYNDDDDDAYGRIAAPATK